MSRHTPLHLAFRRPWPGTRRGLCLWLFSLAFVVLGGVNYIATDLPPHSREALSFALTFAEPPIWGWTMVGVGLVSWWSSYCHFGRDRYGFVLLATFCGGWGINYLCGFLFYDAGLRAVGGSVIWLVFCALLAVIAGFPNVSLSPPPLMADDAEERR